MIFSDYVFVRILFSTLADLVDYAVVSQPGSNLREKIRVFFCWESGSPLHQGGAWKQNVAFGREM